jgi:hypothetical protein
MANELIWRFRSPGVRKLGTVRYKTLCFRCPSDNHQAWLKKNYINTLILTIIHYLLYQANHAVQWAMIEASTNFKGAKCDKTKTEKYETFKNLQTGGCNLNQDL